MSDQIGELRVALFDESLNGIQRTGEVWPLGAFLLAGGMIDTLAGLRFAPPEDRDGKQGERYAAFVHEYFPPPYAQLDMGPKLWRGLRCRPLHNFSTQGVILADSQAGEPIHLREATQQRGVLLHWTEFLSDYTDALGRYWHAVESDPAVRENAERRCERYPPMMVIAVEIPTGASFPWKFPLSFGSHGATGYGGPT
jgi:hypothetical protein